jgi:hypothetical protein
MEFAGNQFGPANLNKNNSGRVSQPCLKNQPRESTTQTLDGFWQKVVIT